MQLNLNSLTNMTSGSEHWPSVGTAGGEGVCARAQRRALTFGSQNRYRYICRIFRYLTQEHSRTFKHVFIVAHIGAYGREMLTKERKDSELKPGCVSEGVRKDRRCSEQRLWWETLDGSGGWNRNQLEFMTILNPGRSRLLLSWLSDILRRDHPAQTTEGLTARRSSRAGMCWGKMVMMNSTSTFLHFNTSF